MLADVIYRSGSHRAGALRRRRRRSDLRLGLSRGCPAPAGPFPGRGIPPESRDKLFLPYYSTKGRGTGLGLAIVHRIVTDHNGSIRVEDNQPRGTVFTMELPGEGRITPT